MNYEKLYRYEGQKSGGEKAFSLKAQKTDKTPGISDPDRADALIRENIQKLAEMQEKLYAQDRYAVLIIFQAMDAAGKDGTVSHVMSGVNPQGCDVHSFKTPTDRDLNHDFLWRANMCLPERGRIGIFNRSYYEEVLVVKVHPELVLNQRIPKARSLADIDRDFWENRYEDIVNYESYLSRNGFVIIKFFLHLSKEEQKNRFLKRIENGDKNWKFSAADMRERAFWDDYQRAYQDAINKTSTPKNPWYVVPADNKWFTRLAVSGIINERIRKLKLEYPAVTDQQRDELDAIRRQLLGEQAD